METYTTTDMQKMAVRHEHTEPADKKEVLDMEDIHEYFLGHLKDEACGAKHYYDLSEVAAMHGKQDLAKSLRVMAYEELSHAHEIKKYLDKWGTPADDDALVHYYKVKELLKM